MDDEQRRKTADAAITEAMAEVRKFRPNTIFTEVDRELGAMKVSFTDFGQSWIDKVITSFLPGVTVYPPLIASGWFGEFFHEFDTWRSFMKMNHLKAFQGVLIRTPDLKTACLRLKKRDQMTNWYGKPFDGKQVGVFCIDRGLIDYLARSFYYAIVIGYPIEPSLNMWRDTSLTANSQSEKIILDATEKTALGQARAAFKNIAADLQFIFGRSDAETLIEAASADHSEPSDEDRYRDIWQYCMSVSIHFLMGHEFGHYAYTNRDEDFSQKIVRFTDQLTKDYSITDPDLIEEVFCDIVGLENCLFQMNFFKIPPAITVCLTAWALLLVANLADREEGTKQDPRIVAWTKYWRHRPLGQPASALALAAEAASLNLRAAAGVISKRQALLSSGSGIQER